MKIVVSAFALLFSFSAFSDTGCGKRGSIDERIADCARPVEQGGLGEAATRVYSTSIGEVFVWRLVTAASSGHQVWRDETPFLDKGRLIWSDASDATMNHWLASEYCENHDRGANAKGSMRAKYRLPDADEFRLSESHGLRQILPNVAEHSFWAGDFISEAEALAFESKDGSLVKTNRGSGLVSVRCVFL